MSPLAGENMYENQIPSGGFVTGIGFLHQKACMIIANNAAVKRGTGAYYPITTKKNLRVQEIAFKNHLPCIYLIDSSGSFYMNKARFP